MLQLMQIVFLIFVTVLTISYKNYANGLESKSCPNNEPFHLSDHSCSSFNEICIKKFDDQCKLLLSACDQCPPNNLTILYLRELTKSAKETSNSTRSFYEKLENILVNKSEYLKMNNFNVPKNLDFNLEKLLSICISTLFFILLLILLILLEIRFKIITKCCEYCFKKDRQKKYKFLESRKYSRQKYDRTKNSNVENNYEEMKQAFADVFTEKFNILQKQINEIKVSEFRTRKFQFKIIGENFEMELPVHEDESVVFIKDLICSVWTKSKEDDYKIMKLKCNEKYLNDNDYLLSFTLCKRDIVKCEIARNVDAKDILVLQIKGIPQRNALAQVDINTTIKEFKDNIKALIKPSNFAIFQKKGGEFVGLEDDKCIKDYQLKDKELIQVVPKEKINFNIQSIFDDSAILPIECFNTDQILSVINKMKSTLNAFRLILIKDSQNINEKDHIFQHNISFDSPVKYCRFNLANYLKILEKSYNNNTRTVLAEDMNKRRVFAKTYSLSNGNNHVETISALIKELSSFIVLKGDDRFVQIYEPYKNEDENLLYIPMEFMEEGSLEDFLKQRNRNGNYATDNEIVNWSKQIIDALDFLHQKNIIHRNLKTSNILLYQGNKLKLSNFGLSKYIYNVNATEARKGFIQTNFQLSRHLAPEMKESNYGTPVDIWSFGIVLLEMNNGKSIYPDLNNDDALMELAKAKENEHVEYTLREDTSENFKKILQRCLEINPLLRASIDEIKNHSYLK